MMTQKWVNIGLSNRLVPGGNKPLPEPILAIISEPQWRYPRVISQETHRPPINKISWEFTYLTFYSNLTGVKELNPDWNLYRSLLQKTLRSSPLISEWKRAITKIILRENHRIYIYILYIYIYIYIHTFTYGLVISPDSKVHGPTWGPPGSCRPQMGPMLAPWTLLSGRLCWSGRSASLGWMWTALCN